MPIAYRKKQEELRLLEEQEAARDAKAGEGGTNFVGFYGNILNARESTAEAVRRTLAAGVVATAMVKDSGKSATTSVDEDRMRDTSMQSGSLGAGLNIIRKATVTQRERIQEHATRKSGTSGMMAPGHAASGGTSVAPVGGQQRTQQRDRLTQAFEKELVEHQREQEVICVCSYHIAAI